MKLVHDWKRCYRWISMNAMVWAMAIHGAWLMLPEDMKAHIPASLISVASIGLLVLGTVGRLVDQQKPK